MGNAAPPPNPKAVKYLQAQLARNPWHESDQIIAKRARALRLEKQASQGAPDDLGERREQVRDTLAGVRAGAFTKDTAELTSRLDALSLEDFPDLRAAADRLRVLLSSRSKFPVLVHSPDFDADLMVVLKKVLVSPARDTALIKERALVSFRKRRLRKRGRRMIRLVRRELPELYALEKDWLDTLASYKQRGFFKTREDAGEGAPAHGVPGWVIWVVIIIVINIIRAIARG